MKRFLIVGLILVLAGLAYSDYFIPGIDRAVPYSVLSDGATPIGTAANPVPVQVVATTTAPYTVQWSTSTPQYVHIASTTTAPINTRWTTSDGLVPINVNHQETGVLSLATNWGTIGNATQWVTMNRMYSKCTWWVWFTGANLPSASRIDVYGSADGGLSWSGDPIDWATTATALIGSTNMRHIANKPLDTYKAVWTTLTWTTDSGLAVMNSRIRCGGN